MLTLKWMIGLFCFLYPTRAEGVGRQPLVMNDRDSESASKDEFGKNMVHADQMTCGTIQALTNRHAT